MYVDKQSKITKNGCMLCITMQLKNFNRWHATKVQKNQFDSKKVYWETIWFAFDRLTHLWHVSFIR